MASMKRTANPVFVRLRQTAQLQALRIVGKQSEDPFMSNGKTAVYNNARRVFLSSKAGASVIKCFMLTPAREVTLIVPGVAGFDG